MLHSCFITSFLKGITIDKECIICYKFESRHGFDPTLYERWYSGGISSEDLRRCGFYGLDFKLLNQLMKRTGSIIPLHYEGGLYPPIISTSWLLIEWCKRSESFLSKTLMIKASVKEDIMKKLNLMKHVNHANEARYGIDYFLSAIYDQEKVKEIRVKFKLWERSELFPLTYKIFLSHEVSPFYKKPFYESSDEFLEERIWIFNDEVKWIKLVDWLKSEFKINNKDVMSICDLIDFISKKRQKQYSWKQIDDSINLFAKLALEESRNIRGKISEIFEQVKKDFWKDY
ncbi:MAG: hypothetical protein QXP60_03665 [Nitrososphaerota archaeon]